ncbi:hypothetical protein K431DRAFT_37931 [Polychaeton citri CBS 116435]|uniref:Uncharacterized protein n=1 Tax=Polychaeton citri CBS 116435 TaxID=1314669 RepID=A0A9P4Q056_9PEZI|nr:hypothetical protein K431DRAFT_37931 [Polychaeton citri CBS 116435]
MSRRPLGKPTVFSLPATLYLQKSHPAPNAVLAQHTAYLGRMPSASTLPPSLAHQSRNATGGRVIPTHAVEQGYTIHRTQ